MLKICTERVADSTPTAKSLGSLAFQPLFKVVSFGVVAVAIVIENYTLYGYITPSLSKSHDVGCFGQDG